MANTFSDLTPIVIGAAMNAVGNRLALLSDFATDLSEDVVSPRSATVQVPFYSAGSTTLVNPSTFGGSDSTGSTVSVTMSALHQPFSITSADYNSGRRIEQLITTNAQALADKIQNLIFSKITTGNFAIGLSGVAPASISTANLKTVWGAVKGNDKVCYLTSEAFANFLPTALTDIDPTLGYPFAGFKKLANADSFTGVTSGVYGFASANKAGLAIASGIPEIAPKTASMIETTTFELGNGLVVAFNYWGDTSSRGDNCSFDVYLGCAVADTNAIKLIKA